MGESSLSSLLVPGPSSQRSQRHSSTDTLWPRQVDTGCAYDWVWMSELQIWMGMATEISTSSRLSQSFDGFPISSLICFGLQKDLPSQTHGATNPTQVYTGALTSLSPKEKSHNG